MLWFGAAILSAILWGLSYATSEQVLKGGVSAPVLLAVYSWIAMPLFTIAAFNDGNLSPGLAIIKSNPKMIFWILIIVSSYFVGNFLIYWAISQKNATSVSFIEISYPFFVALFSWLLFHQNNLSLGTILGGGLIFAGVCTMYFVK